jgi:serine/threonine protein kinase
VALPAEHVVEWCDLLSNASGDAGGCAACIESQPCVGAGAFGAVYRVQWRGQQVAVKVFRCRRVASDVMDTFTKEVDLLCRLEHANVVRWLGATRREPLAIVCEYAEHGSLHSVLHARRGDTREYEYELAYATRLRLLLDAARGMAYLHAQRIVHRDLKSANLLVDARFVCKVCDFGTSRVRSETSRMTGDVGTMAWSAPEILAGPLAAYDDRVDVYRCTARGAHGDARCGAAHLTGARRSFGVVMWEVLTRSDPFDGLYLCAVRVRLCARGCACTSVTCVARVPVRTDCVPGSHSGRAARGACRCAGALRGADGALLGTVARRAAAVPRNCRRARGDAAR